MNPVTKFIIPDAETVALEDMLTDCLNTLKAIGASSRMSIKAHGCLYRQFEALKSSGT